MPVQSPAPSPSSVHLLQLGKWGRHSFVRDHMHRVYSSAGHGIWRQGKQKERQDIFLELLTLPDMEETALAVPGAETGAQLSRARKLGQLYP